MKTTHTKERNGIIGYDPCSTRANSHVPLQNLSKNQLIERCRNVKEEERKWKKIAIKSQANIDKLLKKHAKMNRDGTPTYNFIHNMFSQAYNSNQKQEISKQIIGSLAEVMAEDQKIDLDNEPACLRRSPPRAR